MATASCRQCRGDTYRILVVDDHPRARDMLTTLILLDDQKLDIRSICEAASGEEGIERARIYKPHAVLMDINLPGINGFEAARTMMEDLPSTAILMVTAVAELGQRQEASKLGAAGLVTKDRVATDLIPLLSRVLHQPSVEG